MTARLIAPFVLAAALTLPGIASATTNFWPRTAATSTRLGWGIANTATSLDVAEDGAGGFFLVNDDGYNGHVQHVLANGTLAWPWYVFQLPGSTNGFGNPAITLDGAGGVLVAYETHGGGDELRVLRLNASGAVAPDWPANGLPVCPSSDYDYLPDICTDGDGGAYVAFVRTGSFRVYLQHVLSSGKLDANWPADGVAVQEAGEYYVAPQVHPDGEGGAMIFYAGTPNGPIQLLASRVDRFGNKFTDAFPGSGLVIAGVSPPRISSVRTLDGLYGVVYAHAGAGSQDVYIDVLDNNGRTGFAPPGGLRLSPGPESDYWPAVATNQYRDFLVTWVSDGRIMAARRQQDLSVHPAFPTGLAVAATGTSGYVHHPSIADDGAEGMVIGWRDPIEYSVVRAQHVRNDGSVASGWGAGGQVMATSAGAMLDYQFIFSDGDGGANALFSDNGVLSINRIRRDGSHGLLVPAVFTQLIDVPMDQGGKLSVYWRASEVDTTPANPVGSYLLWRRMPVYLAQSRLAEGAHAIADGEGPQTAGEGAIRRETSATGTIYWEYLGSTPARGWPGYGKTVSTMSDMFPLSSYFPFETFLVETVSPSGVVLATSAPDSGFSMDNLSPATPAAFTGARSGGATHLSWAGTSEPDFALYRLHRGGSAGFLPTQANLVAEVTTPGHVDAGPAASWYKLTAVDVHGNASNYAVLAPSQTLDASTGAPAALAFAPIAPNPARGSAALAFTLPVASHAKLAIFDAQGRHARTLVDGVLPAGSHARTWDLRDGAGRALAPGLYLARLTTPEGTIVRRFAVVE